MDEIIKDRKKTYSQIVKQLIKENGFSLSEFAIEADMDIRTLRKALNSFDGSIISKSQKKITETLKKTPEEISRMIDTRHKIPSIVNVTGGKKLIESAIYFKQMMYSLDYISQIGDGDVFLTSLQVTHDRHKFPALTNLQQHTIKTIKNSPNVNFHRLVRLTKSPSSKYKYSYIREFIYMMEGYKNISLKFFGILDEENKDIIDIAPYSLSSSIQVIECGNRQEGFVFTLHPDCLFTQATTRCNYYNGESEADSIMISHLKDLYLHSWENSVYLLQNGKITKQWKIIEEIFS